MRISAKRGGVIAISLVSMIDVLMIMLVFFMVTSTYLDLDTLPLSPGAAHDATVPDHAPSARPLLIRILPDGGVQTGGQRIALEALGAVIAAHLDAQPGAAVMVLPSGAAPAQALAGVMDAAIGAGARGLRIVRTGGS